MEAASPVEVELTGDLNFTCEAFVFFLGDWNNGVIMGLSWGWGCNWWVVKHIFIQRSQSENQQKDG